MVRSKLLGRSPLFFSILWKHLSNIERLIVALLIVVVVYTGTGLGVGWYYRNATNIPLSGGSIVEGVVGRPQFINPVFARSDVDVTLSSLVFTGLVCRDNQQELTPCLAERWEVSENQREYTFYLRKNVMWHDGVPFTADDVVYTIAVLQNPDYHESLARTWEGVQTTKIDDYVVKFTLPVAYPLFLANLTLGILPRHVWVDIAVKDFARSTFNLNAIGLGPYKVESFMRGKDGTLDAMGFAANKDFVFGAPYIPTIDFRFYKNTDELLSRFARREFSSFGIYSSDTSRSLNTIRGYTTQSIGLPQYVALFLNQKHTPVLQDKAVRQAIAYALDKNNINQKATYGAGIIIHSPILPDYLGYTLEVNQYNHDAKQAKRVLSQSGWTDQDSDGIRDKADTKLTLSLITTKEAQFTRAADAIATQLADIGIKTTITTAETEVLERDYINTRNYDMLLIGENIGADSDPYSYWHSSQAAAPGLNLAAFENGEADRLLEEARQSSDTNVRIKDYQRFQEVLAEELPAIFLYQPVYVYKIYNRVQGVDLSNITSTWNRFSDVRNWFVNFKQARS